VIPTDALRFLPTHLTKYDMIVMDIFDSAEIPEEFQTQAFLLLLKTLLQPNGLLFYNRMHISDSDKKETAAFAPLFKEVFPAASYIASRNNRVYINDNRYMKSQS